MTLFAYLLSKCRLNSRSRMDLVCAIDRWPRSRLFVTKLFVIKKSFLMV